MASDASPVRASRWLLENGPPQLELLFRAVAAQSAAAIPLRENVVNARSEARGEEEGTIRLAAPDGRLWDVEYTAGGSVLPVGLLREGSDGDSAAPSVENYGLLLLDAQGHIAVWYAGAARIYGYHADEIQGKRVAVLYEAGDNDGTEAGQELARATAEGHFGHEGWNQRSDGSRFWANAVTMALRDERGELQGFARIVRDFSERHKRDERLERARARVGPVPRESSIAGIVSGEFDRVREANDAFLKMVGYSREDLRADRLQWADLTPSEYLALDDLAHEESLKFGACTPYEKELLASDGRRVPVLMATAVLKLSPFRWISFIQDLRERDQLGNVADEDAEPSQNFEEMVGKSAVLKRIMRLVEVVAPTDANVLILGETGTGKELVARAIHRLSPRRNFPFVTLNCAAIPTGLLESELFGYEKGAFTGALSQKIGRFELAHRGTLFLDEVGDIPLDLQPKLLRALQEKSFERLGGTRTIPIDVRLVAATNRNLTQMMGDKLFRSDLYYRLKVFPITTAPLRDHAEDIPVLARHFTQKYARAMNKQVDKIPADTMRALVSWSWPGNVRELENFIERAVILSRGPNLRAPLAEIRHNASDLSGTSTLAQVEREHVMRVLRETGGVISKAAARLGMPRTTLNALMRKLGISRRDL